MFRPRVIPCLLLRGRGLVKTVKFKDPTYLGDPVNVVKIFNEKEVDELVLLDIDASPNHRPPPFELIAEIAEECFMPLAYGGNVRSIADIRRILNIGVEKVVINSYAGEAPSFISEAADVFGSQSIVAGIDYRANWRRQRRVYTYGGRQDIGVDPVAHAIAMAERGAGEIMLTAIDRDGTMKGYDLETLREVTAAVNVPVVASGGAGQVADLVSAVRSGGAAAAAAASLFVFQGPHRAVLISFPAPEILDAAFDARASG